MILKVESTNLGLIAASSVRNTSKELLAKNREQLLEGKKRDGRDLTPSYYDDPYFKTRAAAKRYADWKWRITPNPKRKRGTPNLFINGFFHRTIKLNVLGEEIIQFYGAFKQAEIEEKYGEEIFGAGGEKKIAYISESLYPEFKRLMEASLGLKFE